MLFYKHYSVDYAIELFRNPDNGLWFLIVLFVIQLWYLLLEYAFYKIHSKKNSWIIEGVLGIVFITLLYLLNKNNTICSGLYTNVNFYIMFFVASYIAKYFSVITKNDIVLLLSMVGFVVLVPQFHMWQRNSTVLILSISFFASMIILRLSMALENLDVKSYHLLNFGKTSLAIYALHFYLVKVFDGIKLDTSDIAMVPLFVLLALISSFICLICVNLSNVFSKIRLLNLLLLGRK